MFIWNGKCIKNNLYCICLFWWPRLELLTLKSKRIFFDLCIPTCITPGPNLIISQHCSWGRSSCRHAAQTANAKTLLKNWSVRQCRCEHLKPVVCFNHCFPYFLESCVGEIFTWKHIRVESLIHMEVYNWHAFKTHVQTVKPDKQLQTHLWAAALSRPNKLKMEKNQAWLVVIVPETCTSHPKSSKRTILPGVRQGRGTIRALVFSQGVL